MRHLSMSNETLTNEEKTTDTLAEVAYEYYVRGLTQKDIGRHGELTRLLLTVG